MEDPQPSWLTHVATGRKSVSCHLGLSTGPLKFLQDMVFGFPQSKGSQKKIKKTIIQLNFDEKIKKEDRFKITQM